MKKKLLLLGLTYLFFCKGLAQNSCVGNDGSQAAYSPQSCKIPGDGDVYKYIPNSVYDQGPNFMPTLYFRVNFIFLVDAVTPTIYSGVTLQQLIDDVDLTVGHINSKFASSGIMPSLLTPPNPSPLLSNPKIQIVRNNVYRIVSTKAIGPHWNGDTLYNNYPLDTANAINLYFYTDPGNANDPSYGIKYGSGRAVWGRYALLALEPTTLPFPQHIADTYLNNPDLIWHELCHCLGFLGDCYNDLAWYFYRNNDPLEANYTPDDAFIDTSAYNCNVPATLPSNNAMGNSNCRQNLSARQIGAFHYLVAKNVTKKFTQFSAGLYPFIPPTFPFSPTAYDLTGTQVLGSIPPFSTLTVKSNANITLKSMNIFVPSNAKIIVEQGGRLNLKCVSLSLHPQYSGTWEGIEVWGSPTMLQTILPNGLNSNQGILDMDNCYITKARKAVLVGKRNPTGYQNTYGFGGGVLLAKDVTFENNEEDVTMNPNSTNVANLTTINSCEFRRSSNFNIPGPSVKRGMVNLHGVKDIKFYLNHFLPSRRPLDEDTTICIRGINSSVIVGDMQNSGGNIFDSAFYAIHMVGGYKNIIDDNWIFTRNGIYISNSNYNRITNNKFRLDFVSNYFNSNSLRTGIYMNECNNFKIEKNEISTVNLNQNISEGICINNSGPVATQIYNNTLTRLNQGIWCQNQNYDPNSPTQDGLVINCNNFTNCNYNIGVQTPMVIGYGFPVVNYIYTNWQSNFSQYCFYGGISPSQGVTYFGSSFYVRNTYNNVQASGNENKFYSFTPYSTPPVVSHGNFLEPALPTTPKYGVAPQPAYSNPSDVTNLVGLAAPASRDLYCPDLSALPSKFAVNSQLATLNSDINVVNANFVTHLDGGYTQVILNAINSSSIASSNLKIDLINKDYLSDTVLISYFTPTIVPATYVKEVFEKNAPVSKKVWNVLVARNLPTSIFDTLKVKQAANKLSERSKVLAQLSLMKNQRSYAIMHKSMLLMDDPTATHVKDSIAALITMNGIGDVSRQLIELDFTFGDYPAAKSKLATYTLTNTSQKNKYVSFKTVVADLMADSLKIYKLATDNTRKALVEAVATDYDHPCMQEARNILFAVFDKYYPEQKLIPEEEIEEGGGRLMSQIGGLPAEANKIEMLANGINLYPNPASSEIYINNMADSEFNVSITNVNGQTVIYDHAKARQLNKIDISVLLNGIYFVNLFNEKTLIKTTKLVIVK